MAHTTPQVDTDGRVVLNGAPPTLLVGSTDWYAWLEAATTFAFIDSYNRFTARKERPERAGGYWKAYRKHAGRLYSAYLGKSADLTLDRLAAVARQFDPLRAEPVPVSLPPDAPALEASNLPLQLLNSKLAVPAACQGL